MEDNSSRDTDCACLAASVECINVYAHQRFGSFTRLPRDLFSKNMRQRSSL